MHSVQPSQIVLARAIAAQRKRGTRPGDVVTRDGHPIAIGFLKPGTLYAFRLAASGTFVLTWALPQATGAA